MSAISFISPGHSAARAWQAASLASLSVTDVQAAPSTLAFESDPLAASLEATIASSVDESLLDLQGRIEAPIAASNALATAAGAITEIGNAINTIQKVLGQPKATSQAAPGSAANDKQSTIDAAIQSIDSISTSSKFLGAFLLDGTYSSAGQAIPPLSTRTLGAVDPSGARATLDTLLSGGINDLASGNLPTATTIAAAAAQQVGSTGQLNDSLRAVAVGTALLAVESGPPGIDSDRTPDLASALTLAQQAGAMMIADLYQSSAAVANVPATHVLAMV